MSSYFEELTANARQKLVESSNELTGYTKNIRPSHLIWAPKGFCGNQVVSIEATAKAVKAAAERLQDPTMPAAEADTLEPFIFSMIVSITSEDFFALPCGRWMGPTVVAPTFADAKLTFTGGVPADPRLARDFQQSCAKIVQIFESVRPSGTHEQRGVLLKQEDPVSRIKLRFTHRLFQKVEEGEEEDDDIPPPFTIDHWPVRHQQAREAIAGMTATHRVNYLPAYNAIGNLIYPDDYEAQLRGALAQVRFTLSHWNIRQQDVFTANIEHIRILTPPPPHPASPSKRRKFTATDDVSGDISPKKARPANGP